MRTRKKVPIPYQTIMKTSNWLTYFQTFHLKLKKKLITNKKEDKNVNLIIFNKKGITTLIAKTRKKTKLS